MGGKSGPLKLSISVLNVISSSLPSSRQSSVRILHHTDRACPIGLKSVALNVQKYMINLKNLRSICMQDQFRSLEPFPRQPKEI